MYRLLRTLVLVAVLAGPMTMRGVTSAGAQAAIPSGHPLVGAWMFDLRAQSPEDPLLYALFHSDGTWLLATPYFGDGVGVWQATGVRTADATVVFQDLNSDPNQMVPGTITARMAIEVTEAGDVFTARWVSEDRWPDGTLVSHDDGMAQGTRLAVDMLPAPGTPVASAPAELPSQPTQPVVGPGSDNTPFPAARATKYGPDPGGFWLWEPTTGTAADAPVADGPFPVILYVDGCCQGDYPNPPSVDPWLTHLAQQGYVVISPVYRATSVLADVPARLRDALEELAQPGHPEIDLSRFAVAGYSFGGVPAVTYAATAAAAGLPVPDALFVMAPCFDGSASIGATPGSTCQVLPPGIALPPGLKAVELAFGQDFRVGRDMPLQVWSALASLPASDRDFVVMPSDGHGMPPVVAHHETPVDDVDAADWFGAWKLSDALFACAFEGTWCEFALGNTPGQRYMGTWSDGAPVAELQVLDDATASTP
jgi:acetyl esterase/lipase